MKYIVLILLFGWITPINTNAQQTEAFGNRLVKVFDNKKVYFEGGLTDNGALTANDSTITIMNGRMILKKINIPNYKRDVEIWAKITLKSAGDRWDKSGSCFVIPANSKTNFIRIFNQEQCFPQIPDKLEKLKGVIPGDNYLPAIEVIRFMTPFGVGAYSDTMKYRKPVYIPHWEKQVVWQQNVTQLVSELTGEFWIGIWIDTWVKEGYLISLELNYNESDYECAVRQQTKVQPLLNTIYYIDGQEYPDIFARKNIQVDFELPQNATNVKLHYITTGHGGHSGGDEFVKKENIIQIDGKTVHRFIPWRDDCAAFRRFNPASGVWLVADTARHLNWEKRKYELKPIEERIASSDYSRSNWCPGSDVPPVVIPLKNIKAGKHTITFSIPEAQEMKDNELNHWLVSAYLVYTLCD